MATDGPTFWLRPKLMELGDLYLDRLGLPALARQHLALLAERVRDTCSLTILDGDTVVYVDRVKASRLMTVNIAVGTRLPAFIMSSGRVLLADLPPEELEDYLRTLTPGRVAGCTRSFPEEIKGIIERARVDGFAIADQELDPTLRSIAAPVYADGRAVAAVNISTPVGRTSSRQLREEVLPELLQTTRAIGAELAVNLQIEH
ncbi:IclR family transcriptional regulator C-terminal domain-containing protein (plasmid) [Rhodococcoides fascians]|uniref:IclR family transcriptional regulator domain-containing protein n=1 Tax=Rhodococcoides fascians TaxID=1828 RepID=UPI002ACE80BC|nr:IclR family transcriptional regulator C-terminal domain-containing protein [Rhodococcus fascians]WQH31221.1 IclR family transcriptional regulator C-terminal domain-containing protein [Rhodococcus fascians]